MNLRADTLRRLPLWQVFPEELLRVVAEPMEEIAYAPGDAIIRRGEPGRHLHVLLAGRADVRITSAEGVVTTVATMKAGDTFGEMSLLSEDLTSADVIAAEPCETLALARDAFHALVSTQPVLLRELVRLLSQRVKASDVAIGVARQKQEDLTRFLQEEKSEKYAALIGKTKPIAELVKQIAAKGRLATPLLVRGEKGSGKELVARLVHRGGPRKGAPLVVARCEEITESPWGDTLFGLDGVATATQARGLSSLALADGGTLLLKNVEALPPTVQARLLRFLRGEPLATGARPDARVIATCRANLLEETMAGRFSAELASLLLADVLEVPPLRERKRDVPELAAHFVKRHAERQGRKVPALDDQAVTKLVEYDYAFANVEELEEAIARAVILTDGDTIAPEAIFLGPPPSTKPRGLNLLKLPQPLVAAALKLFPTGVRAMTALVFLFILLACFAWPSGPKGNVATVLVWAVWWPGLIVSFFFAGRAWCAICPMAASGELAQRLVKRFRPAERRVPAWLKEHDASLVMAGFFGIVWVEEVAGMRHAPVATGFLLLAIIVGAVVTSAFLPRRSWCRHLCPMGGLAGLCSTSSLVELRPTADICAAKCKGHACFKGDASLEGCPMFQHVMFVDSNRDCVLCLNCVKLCPNGSPQLNLRLPGRELWTNLGARVGLARFVVMLLGLLVGQALVQAAEGRAAALPALRASIEQHRLGTLTLLLAVCAAVPLLVLRLAEGRGGDAGSAAREWRRVTSWAPLVAAGYTAYQFGNVPGLDRLRLTLGGLAGALPDPLVSLRLLPAAQALALATGLLLTIVTLFKLQPPSEGARVREWVRREALHLAAAAAYAGVLLVLIASPAWLGAS